MTSTSCRQRASVCKCGGGGKEKQLVTHAQFALLRDANGNLATWGGRGIGAGGDRVRGGLAALANVVTRVQHGEEAVEVQLGDEEVQSEPNEVIGQARVLQAGELSVYSFGAGDLRR
jgi:hypothetical protein